ncbi:importin alpha re-exporter [Punctularia strigosozonata HHB-11173 SS5]|uniref:importin alpha re-exporter n=1 Tax=Punctularia strigosozonata (strain HHB-11173) TaxID=741275 RepID=UPI00044179D3|nr:importin alpha re-exporter [Punctularia strigosozonata HHB-11173 SS5]EIN12120.1 importin alpha re-exporter [Punctularia strigosozonata HHB-11173 SS5]
MADLSQLLLASLNPSTRKDAEASLTQISLQPGFLSHLLRLVLTQTENKSVRLAGSVYLKNTVKNRWDDETDTPISPSDKDAIRTEIIPAMITLSSAGDKASRTQIADAVSIIASFDFPEQWPQLITQLVSSLSESDYSVNVGVLETAHSIFRPWRSAVRSDALFSTINLVLAGFMQPFLNLFRHTSSILLSTIPTVSGQALQTVAQAQSLATDVIYDLTCQDLPPDVEDNFAEFFGPNGLFLRFLAWKNAELSGDPDDTTPSLSSQIKTGILEISEMYTKLYPEMMQSSHAVPSIVRAVWDLIGAGQLNGVGDDGLVSQALRFISATIRSGHYKDLFGSQETITGLVQGVVVPNVGLREHEVEQFEDDPLEFIRQDLALPSLGTSDAPTRRQAAADVVRALVASGLEAETTRIVGQWITSGLTEYHSNPSQNWKAKDSAIYLLTAVATKGSTTQHGVTSTNALVDVVQFFSENVFQDLQSSSVHPILQVDAIKFLYTFRNQLSKEQLLSVLPLLHKHLSSDNYVCYTYAAITIDQILFIKQNNQLMFSQTDIHDIAPSLLEAILTKIESGGSPQKIAENDYLMKSAMRVIITARQTLTPGYQTILQRLVSILGVISTNPSNPNFDQYIFESISALIRFVASGTPSTLPTFEQALFPAFTVIIQQDIDQYIPYTFQIIAQMLELHKTDVPTGYRELLPFLLTPAVWQQKGSIPGLVKLLKAFLARDVPYIISSSHYQAVLGVIQGRLIPSKLNDVWGFELLQSVIQYVPPTHLQQHLKPLLLTLLTRMQTSKTDKYVYHFSYFVLFTLAIPGQGLTPDFLIRPMEEIQPGLWSQVLTNFVVPQTPKMPPKDRKVAAVGLTRLLTQSEVMFQSPSVNVWPAAFSALVRLFQEPQHLKKDVEEDPDAGLTAIDYEEQNAGYQAAYSKLAASEGAPVDPVASIRDPREYLGQELVRVSKTTPVVKSLIRAGDSSVVTPFVQQLAAAGFAF